MDMATYKTDTDTRSMLFARGMLLIGGMALLATELHKLYLGEGPSLAGIGVGIACLFNGLIFDHFWKGDTITIGQEGIRYTAPETAFDDAKEKFSSWKYITEVTLNNFSIEVVEEVLNEHSATTTYRLPFYTKKQFDSIKEKLRQLSDQKGARFKIKSWW
ncbi:hypothetical protein [Fodinibius halophilus]|nr:hypothetical protein [Fodinibius halophilus]